MINRDIVKQRLAALDITSQNVTLDEINTLVMILNKHIQKSDRYSEDTKAQTLPQYPRYVCVATNSVLNGCVAFHDKGIVMSQDPTILNAVSEWACIRGSQL